MFLRESQTVVRVGRMAIACSQFWASSAVATQAELTLCYCLLRSIGQHASRRRSPVLYQTNHQADSTRLNLKQLIRTVGCNVEIEPFVGPTF